MARGIYVAAATPSSGKSLVTLGLADMLHRHADRIGFFRPIVDSAVIEEDPMILLFQQLFDLDASRCTGAMTRQELRSLLAAGERDEIATRAVSAYSKISSQCDVVIIEGTDLGGQDVAMEFELNAQLARDLGTPLIAVVNAQGSSPSETSDSVDVARRGVDDAKADLLAVLVNRAEPGSEEEIRAAIRPGRSGRPVYVIPELDSLALPSIGEVREALGARQIAGSSAQERDVTSVKVAAMHVGHLIGQLDHGSLVIAPSDRADVMLATLASSLSPEFPVPSGLVLTGGFSPESTVLPLLAVAPFPVFTVDCDTFSAAQRISGVTGQIATGSPRKAAAALGAWAKEVDESELLERLALPRPQTMTPLRFLHELIERARSVRRHIVLPEGSDERILRAAEILVRRDVCDLTVLGDPHAVRELASAHGIDLSGVNIEDPATSERRETFAEEYARLRQAKGITLEQARERMLDVSYFGTMMVHLGIVDGMVSGAAHTTAHTIRPALEFIKTRPGVKIVSSVFLMLLADRVLVYGDCAVNPEPNEAQLADIAAASAETAVQFGVDPRIAMLSYSTGTSGSGEAVDRVRAATELLRSSHPDLAVEGPIQYDAAVDASIAHSKLPDSAVAGQATVFVFPDLNTGNNTYKAVQQSSGAVAVGPVLQGLNKPVNDLSRGCTVEDIVNTVAITAIQAQTDASGAAK